MILRWKLREEKKNWHEKRGEGTRRCDVPGPSERPSVAGEGGLWRWEGVKLEERLT